MKSFCIIGMNRFGQALALSLASAKRQVMIIDENVAQVNALADFVTAAIIGDPKDEKVLTSAGVTDYDCTVVCSSGEIDDSILITLLLKDIGVPYVVSRAQSDLHARILKKVGADRVVYPEKDMGERLARVLSKNNVVDYFALSDDCSVVELNVPASWVGKNMIDLDLRRAYGVNVIAVVNGAGRTRVSPDPHAAFVAGTKVILVGTKKSIDRLS